MTLQEILSKNITNGRIFAIETESEKTAKGITYRKQLTLTAQNQKGDKQTMKEQTRRTLESLGYNTANISEERTAAIEWVLYESTEEQQDKLLKFLRALKGSK